MVQRSTAVMSINSEVFLGQDYYDRGVIPFIYPFLFRGIYTEFQVLQRSYKEM